MDCMKAHQAHKQPWRKICTECRTVTNLTDLDRLRRMGYEVQKCLV